MVKFYLEKSMKVIDSKKLLQTILVAFVLYVPNVKAQIPVVDFSSIANGAKDIVNTVKETKFVTDAVTLAGKANAAIGDAKKSLSEFALDDIEKAKEMAEQAKKYQEQITDAVEEAKEYKAYADAKLEEAKAFQESINSEIDKAKELKDSVSDEIDKAKDLKDSVVGEDADSEEATDEEAVDDENASDEDATGEDSTTGETAGNSSSNAGSGSGEAVTDKAGNTAPSTGETAGNSSSNAGSGSGTTISDKAGNTAPSTGATISDKAGNTAPSTVATISDKAGNTAPSAGTTISDKAGNTAPSAGGVVAVDRVSAGVSAGGVVAVDRVSVGNRAFTRPKSSAISNRLPSMTAASGTSAVSKAKNISTMSTVSKKAVGFNPNVAQKKPAGAMQTRQSSSMVNSGNRRMPSASRTRPARESFRRGGASPALIERRSSVVGSEKVAFANKGFCSKVGKTKEGVFIFPQAFAMECCIGTDDVIKEGVMDKCLKEIVKKIKKGGVEGDIAKDVYALAVQQMAAAYVEEAMQMKNDASVKEKEVIDPINDAPSTTDLDGTAILNQMNTELVKTMNSLMSVYTSKLAFDAIEAYGSFELAPTSLNFDDEEE